MDTILDINESKRNFLEGILSTIEYPPNIFKIIDVDFENEIIKYKGLGVKNKFHALAEEMHCSEKELIILLKRLKQTKIVYVFE